MKIPLVDLQAQYKALKPEIDAALQGVVGLQNIQRDGIKSIRRDDVVGKLRASWIVSGGGRRIEDPNLASVRIDQLTEVAGKELRLRNRKG